MRNEATRFIFIAFFQFWNANNDRDAGASEREGEADMDDGWQPPKIRPLPPVLWRRFIHLLKQLAVMASCRHPPYVYLWTPVTYGALQQSPF